MLFDFYLQLAWVPPKTTKDMIDANRAKDTKRKLTLEQVMEAAHARHEGKDRFSMRAGRELYRAMLAGELSAAAVLTQGGVSGRSGAYGGGSGAVAEEAVHVQGFWTLASAASRSGHGRECFVETAGGINLPKIVECLGSDGSVHKQLVKGKDDLRQDSVMQQVFQLVNVLLRHDPEARKRALQMRTYRVVPLAPTAGVLQWVDNTIPLASYMTNAHARYRKADWSNQDCRNTMAEARRKVDKQDKPPTYLLSEYRRVCKHFRPVLHHFFLERWPHPSAWFERRLAYARSLAAGSMVGFTLGLGDRHASNILIDLHLAELVHIDLGIAFGAGKLLPTPERVPFRLTRDLEDALGVCGVEGVMRGASEHTMRVLRHHAEQLLTILEVFVTSPLQRWICDPVDWVKKHCEHADTTTIVPSATASRPTSRAAQDSGEAQWRGQGGLPQPTCGDAPSGPHGDVGEENDAEVNREAEHVLLSTKEKLTGRAEEGLQLLAVEAQVALLLEAARSELNLSQMYDGWAAWC